MPSYTATPGIGQWISRAVETTSSSLTAVQSPSHYPVFKLVWQEQTMPTFVVGESNLIDEQELARLYMESAEEDLGLANMGMSDYARLLAAEDKGA